uniref:SANT domain-containing protein n=1 Tax=Caenorhabditis japonica TaxID=281687 RepID=A0A8R1DWD2_CAEJA
MAEETEPPACFSCTLQLTETIHVKCFECNVCICMLCFQCGAESPPHRRGHNYELVKGMTPSRETGQVWIHDDEFELLKAAHKFKMGNWGEIAESIGRGRKNGQECKDYFEKNFVRGWIGQFSIKSANWDKIKYGMYINQTLDSVVHKNCLESTERMLLIRDAVRASGENIDENDPKVAVKVQQILEQYIQKCIDGEVDIKYERPKILTHQFETELSADECDPDQEIDTKRKLVKIEIATDDSDLEDSPGPSGNYRSRPNGPSSPKKRKPIRVMRESSSDSDDNSQDNSFHGLERETEDEDVNESAFETAPEGESDEEEEKKPKKETNRRQRKRKRQWMTKKSRRLDDFRKKMNRDQKRAETKLAALSNICSLEEVKELRSAYPRLFFENGVKSEKTRIRGIDDLVMLGYNVDREEFETEWFNDAEQLISRLTISATPPEKDQKLDIENDIKFARLRHYIRILGIRKAKRNTILEHDKINEFFKYYKEMCVEKRKGGEILESRSEKEKLLAMTQQFLTRDEYQALRSCMERLDGLMDRIEVLQELQRNGETSLKNAPPAQAQEKKKRKLRKIDCEQRKKIATEWTKYKKWHSSGWE